MKTVIITRKIQIRSDDVTFWPLMREYSFRVFCAANRVMQVHYLRDALENDLIIKQVNEETLERPKRAEVKKVLYGKESAFEMSEANLGYTVLKNEFSDLSSYVRSSLSNNVYNKFKAEINDVRSGRKTQTTYRNGMPFPFMKSAMTDFTENGFNFLKLPVQFVYGADKSGNRAIVKKIIKGDYQLCDSSIQVKDKKAFLLLCVKLPVNTNKEEDITAIVDISHKCPVKIQLSTKNGVVEVGDTAHVERIIIGLSRRLTEAQKSVKYAKGGHGRARKLKFLNNFEELEKNTAKTLSHTITKAVLNVLIKERVSKITIAYKDPKVLENEEEKKYLIRFWGYFQMAEQLKNKAIREGIEVAVDNSQLEEENL